MPAVSYSEENRKILEKGYLFSKEELWDRRKQDREDEK